MNATSLRYAVVDMAKGIAIVLVVYGHCLRGLIDAGLVAPRSWLGVTDYVVYTFHMPLFFAASGLFFRNAEKRSGRNFLIGRLKSIAYPYFLWSMIHGSIQLAMSGSATTNHALDGARLMEIAWNPIPPFWFLYALFFANLLMWMLRRLSIAIVAGLAFVAFLGAFFVVGWVLSDVTYGFLYFSLGVMAGDRGWLRVLPTTIASALGAMALFMVVSLGSYFLHVPERLPFLAAVTGIYAVAVSCAVLEARGARLERTLTVLGQYSMSIYVLHIMVLVFVRTVLIRFFGITQPGIIMLIAIPPAVILPMIAQHLLVRWNANEIAGLPFSAGSRRRDGAAILPS